MFVFPNCVGCTVEESAPVLLGWLLALGNNGPDENECAFAVLPRDGRVAIEASHVAKHDK
jgi:hypothetical protein